MNLEHFASVLLDPGVPPALIYAAVFLSCVLESFFPPWPTDVIAVYAGFLAGRGLIEVKAVFVAAVVGTQLGVMTVFWISRRWGRALLAGPMGRYLPAERLGSLEGWFARYGAPAIAVSRFFPGIRALVMPAAGLAHFAAWKVWVFAGVSVVVWNVFVVGIGLFAGTHLESAKQILVRYNMWAGIVVGAGLLVWGVVYLRRRYSGTSSNSPLR